MENTKLKILFPIGSFYPSTFGGPGEILYWHGVYLKKNNINPIFVTTNEGITKEIKANEFLSLPCGEVYYGNGNTLKLKTLRVMFAQIKKVDIIHLTSLFSPISILCFLYTRLFHRKKKIIWSVRGELNNNALKISKRKKQLFISLYKALGKRIVFASTAKKESKEIKNIFQKNKVVEIPNLMPKPEKAKRDINEIRFLFLGRIHPIKNIEALIKGFSNCLKEHNIDCTLDIIGDVEDRNLNYLKELKELVASVSLQKNIFFKNHISGKEKDSTLANAYFLILPSHTENFGNVVIEALSQSTPVIATQNSPWQVLEEFECGFWIKNDVETIAKTIKASLSLTTEEYLAFRNNAEELINEKYNIESRIQDWIVNYKSLLVK